MRAGAALCLSDLARRRVDDRDDPRHFPLQLVIVVHHQSVTAVLRKGAPRDGPSSRRGSVTRRRLNAETSFSAITSPTVQPSRPARARASSSCRTTPAASPARSSEIRTSTAARTGFDIGHLPSGQR
jgi:hypothetical protein